MPNATFSFLQFPGRWLLAGALGLAAGPLAHGQSFDSLSGISQSFDNYSQATLSEKLFVHLDRPTYAAGETMWLKVYAVDGTLHKPLPMSKVAYVEVLDQAQQPVLQAKLALHNATGQGSLVLPTGLPSGRYVVRAYTSWMKNFSPDFYFHCPVSIINTFRPSGSKTAGQLPAYDVQFFPEGGSLVQGLRSKVGLRVLSKNGKSLEASGSVLDAQGAVVASFQTLKFGLGSFVFTPAAGQNYSATVRLANQTIVCKLPPVREAGYVLSLEEAETGQLRLAVQSQGTGLADGEVFLLGHKGQQILVASQGQVVAGQASFMVDKRLLADGITHFTLFDAAQKPRCERLYFQRPRQALALSATADQRAYGPRQKVTLRLAAPASTANLSLAVYQLDSLSASRPADISTFLTLTSELKGAIEDPTYYLRDSSQMAQTVADNLMLTQGWSRFRWEDVLAGRPGALPNPPELNSHFVRGQVVNNETGTPAAGVTAYLATPSRAARFYNSTSRAGGMVQFEPNSFYGPTKLVLQTNTQLDSTYRLEIFSPFSTQFAPSQAGPLELPRYLAAALTQRHVQVQTQQVYFSRFQHPYTQPAHDTVAFYGQADERYLLDDYTRFPTMEDVMREYVPGVQVRKRKDGFHFMVVDRPNQTIFHDNPMVLLDGVPVFSINQIMKIDPLKIRKLDVITGHYFHGQQTYDGLVSYTTYRGDLAGVQLPTQALIEEYEGLQGQREFFAPRYDAAQQQQSRLPDFRNLLYWQPTVQLRAGQPQLLDFYTSDQVGRYLVVAQGLAADGRAGSTSFTFEVKPAL